MASTLNPHAAAQRHLTRSGPEMAALIRRVGPCTLVPHADLFSVLARTVISQQLSTKAAVTIGNRVLEALGLTAFHPRPIRAATVEALRGCGLSAGKTKSLQDLAEKVESGELPLTNLPAMPDEEVSARLRTVHGIGPWSVDMFLIFGMGRLDVLPVGDLGLRYGVRDLFGLKAEPPLTRIAELTDPWRPYRSIATWYLWRGKDQPQPQPKVPARPVRKKG